MMTIEEILFSFNDREGHFPREALAAALEQQEALTPHLLSILEKIVAQPEEVSSCRMDHMFALYVLSKYRETKAFPLIIALAELSEEVSEDLLGDSITESLPRFIVSTFNGDLGSIKHLIENENANLWCRDAALRSLLGLIALHQLSREEVVDYVRTLFHSPLADDEVFMTSLVEMSSDLYPEELLPEINQAFNEDKVDSWMVDKELIDQMLVQGREACLSEHVYEDQFHLPIEDVEEAMSWMGIFDRHVVEEDGDSASVDHDNTMVDDFSYVNSIQTYERDAPKVGRNELCFCGSGKKFKKCCLA